MSIETGAATPNESPFNPFDAEFMNHRESVLKDAFLRRMADLPVDW